MKHLKKFENVIIRNNNIKNKFSNDRTVYSNNDLKKYFIIDSEKTDDISLYEVNDVDNELVRCVMSLYVDNRGLIDWLKLNNSNSKWFRFYLSDYNIYDIVYQTDNLDDAIEKLEIIRNANKYNL